MNDLRKDLDELQERADRLEKKMREILVHKIVEGEVQLGLVTDEERENLKVELADNATYSLQALTHIVRVLESFAESR